MLTYDLGYDLTTSVKLPGDNSSLGTAMRFHQIWQWWLANVVEGGALAERLI